MQLAFQNREMMSDPSVNRTVKKGNRHRADIISDILRLLASNPVGALTDCGIVSKALLSFVQWRGNYRPLLLSAGLVEPAPLGGNLCVTTKGRKYLSLQGEIDLLLEPDIGVEGNGWESSTPYAITS